MATKPQRQFLPAIAISPGELLAEELEARGMTQKDLAEQMGRPPQAISAIVQGKKAITAETALQLERVLGISAQLWAGLEADYRLILARQRLAAAKPAPARKKRSA